MTTTIQRGLGRVQFLANIESIRKGINEGFPLNAVFAEHQDKLDITYSQFARYVKKYIKEPAAPVSLSVSKPVAIRASETPTPTVDKSITSKLEILNNPMPLSDEELF